MSSSAAVTSAPRLRASSIWSLLSRFSPPLCASSETVRKQDNGTQDLCLEREREQRARKRISEPPALKI
eukprot:381189-Rhodomonas_salina.4